MLLFFFLLLFFLLIQESLQVVLRHLQFLILFLNHSILNICIFLFLKKFRIFLIENFNFGNATSQLTKCFLGSFVKKYFLKMCLKELFTISGFSISHIYILCLRIINDVRFQNGNFCHSLFCILYRLRQL